jgi:hypothetical protein
MIGYRKLCNVRHIRKFLAKVRKPACRQAGIYGEQMAELTLICVAEEFRPACRQAGKFASRKL